MTMPALRGDMSADELVQLLQLQPHPEGGWFRETWRAPSPDGQRAAATQIYYLLKAGEVSAWHRVDAAEIWHWYAGGPLVLTTSPPDGKGATAVTLGPALRQQQSYHHVVQPHYWQAAESLGAFTLVGCTVAPGFDFAGFELAPRDWRPTL